jgi:nucleoside 2-deoxyribosyltransferase
LFSDAERFFNERLTALLEQWFEVYLPQRDGELMYDLTQRGMPAEIAAARVFQSDLDAIRKSSYLIAILDGRAIDEGVGFELGVAHALGKICLGLQTDSRRLAPWGNNPMVTGGLYRTFTTVDDLLGWANVIFENRNEHDRRNDPIGSIAG